MADYRELLRRAVEALPENNGASRRQVYEKARNALVAQLRAIEPPLPAREITQHRLQLEDCIRQVEQQATEQLLSGFKALESESAAPVAPAEVPVAPEPAGYAEPEPAEVPQDGPEELPAEDTFEAEEETIAAAPEEAYAPAGEPLEAAEEADESVADELPPAEPYAPEAEDDGADALVAEPEPETIGYAGPEPEPDFAAEAGREPEFVAEVEPETGSSDQEEPAPAEPADDQLYVVEGSGFEGTDGGEGYHGPATVEEAIALDETASVSGADAQDSADPITRLISEADAERADALDEPVFFPSGGIESVGPAPSVEPDLPESEPDETVEDGAPADFHMDEEPRNTAGPGLIGVASAAAQTQQAGNVTAMFEEREVDVDPAAVSMDTDSDAQSAIDRAIETLDREARGESGAGDGVAASEAGGEDTEDAIAEARDESEGGGAITIFLIVLALLLAGAGGAGYWAWQEGYIDVESLLGQSETIEGVATAPEATQPAEPAGPGNTTATPDTVSPVNPEMGKIDERLPAATPNAEGSQTPTGTAETPAPETAPGNMENKSEERLTGNGDSSFGAAGTAAESGTTEPDAAGEAETPPAVVAQNGAQSLLLEASSEGTTGAVPYSGSVEWSRGTDELGQPTILASADIPARDLSVNLLIRRNADPALPASHLMEIDFSVNDSFIGGSIASLPGVLLKNEELVRGTPLVGASARVVGNSFLFALSAEPQDLATNRDLLGTRKWMDLALIYATSTRAIITLEKDEAAQALFEDVMAVWAEAAAEDAAAAGSGATPSAAEGVNLPSDLQPAAGQ